MSKHLAVLIKVVVGAIVLACVAAAILATWRSGSPPPDYFGVHSWPWFVWVGLVWAITGGLLVLARPRNAIGWLMMGVGSVYTWTHSLLLWQLSMHESGGLSLPRWVGIATDLAFNFAAVCFSVVLPALYPNGRLPSRRWLWPIAAACVAAMGGSANYGPTAVYYPDIGPEWLLDIVYTVLYFLSPLAVYVGLIVQFSRSRPPERQQLAWFVFLVLPALIVTTFNGLSPWRERGLGLIVVAMFLVPVAVGVGVLRHRLFGIEWVLRRWLVYGILTVLVFALYVAATSAVEGDLLPGVPAAAIVAVALAPTRDRLQRVVDRIVYGEHSDPVRIFRRLEQELSTHDESELVLAALNAVAAAVRAPGAAVLTLDGTPLARVGRSSQQSEADAVLPIDFGGRPTAVLQVSAPNARESYTDTQVRLLSALTPLLGVILRSRELAEALQAERDRVVAATSAERDRLRRDLHDGLGPSLSGVSLVLQALPDLLDGADPAATQLVHRVRVEVATAIAEVKRIIEDLRPVSLETRGLIGAVKNYAETLSAALTVDVHADLPALPAITEAALYRIVTEALTNAARHAGANNVQVSMTVSNNKIRATVADDGHGLDTSSSAGVGLHSMRRRAEALGGHLDVTSTTTGTTVTAVLPLEES